MRIVIELPAYISQEDMLEALRTVADLQFHNDPFVEDDNGNVVADSTDLIDA